MTGILDHLVYAAPTLESGIAAIERLTGVTASPGGRHPGRGTQNALLALGPHAYLEIVAPDPDQVRLPGVRWLGVDGVSAPRLTTWAVRAEDLDALVRRAAAADVLLGAVQSGARQRADGIELAWRLTNPSPLVADGVVPFFIDWGASPHPATSAAPGISLVDGWVEHPEVEHIGQVLSLLGIAVAVRHADRAGLVAVFETPRGRVTLR